MAHVDRPTLRLVVAAVCLMGAAACARSDPGAVLQARVVAYASASAFAVLDPAHKLKRVKLTGIVTKVEWTNPHVWFYFNVKSAEKSPDGGKTWVPGESKGNWGAEMGPPHGLQRQGWRRDSLKIGEEVTVVGSLAKNGTQRMNANSVTLSSTGGRPGQTLDAASSQGQNP